MGADEQYDGYESYEYLDAGDYRSFELPNRHSGFEPYEVPLSEAEEARAERVAAENYVVSFHKHTFHLLYGDHTALLEVLADFHGIELPESTLQSPYVKGLENPTKSGNNIVRWLVKHDYTNEEIEKVLGENVLRAHSKRSGELAL